MEEPFGPRTAKDPPLREGDWLGAYRIVRLLDDGGGGWVYLAEHATLECRVAVKVLRPELSGYGAARRRFLAEARVARALSSDHVVEVLDLARDPERDLTYIVMELLEGRDLGRLIDDEGALPVLRAVHVGRQLACALRDIHRAGVIHRDIKPSNIVLVDRGGDPDFVKVLDFGVAKLTDRFSAAGVKIERTAPGVLFGTPAYMAPEQIDGRGVDARTDVYALGVLLFEMLTASRPFEGESFAELALAKRTREPPSPSELVADLPPALDELVRACLARSPAARPATMAVVEARLGKIRRGLARRQGRRRVLGWTLAAAAAAVLGGIGAGLVSLDPSRGEGPPVRSPRQPAKHAPTERALAPQPPSSAPAAPLSHLRAEELGIATPSSYADCTALGRQCGAAPRAARSARPIPSGGDPMRPERARPLRAGSTEGARADDRARRGFDERPWRATERGGRSTTHRARP